MQGATMHPSIQHCIDNCIQCHTICEQTSQYCLQQGGMHANPEHQRILQDCAQICQTSADFMLRASPFHPLTCGVCAQVCISCAESCETMKDDAQMQICAQICRKCAESCREMAQVHY